ncbi:ATP-grasp fold amidoligase family protein [Clostridium perfringens]|uniref:ATP-grasp fold amidoligase family protein n=1 Tax=Clostridium perfringens TaxID=1502 RepID=UPI0022E3D13A|nr:ATP-grasp fold amidoligase family protein [Clostridium perfringens]MDK0781473.1 ATP-grasp fold amidoligase family protein [Clostridium perfringens]MDM0559253.1 ATP-grasp fold amidoligase family protein [Clostridium perfringens]MDM0590394.1 ATP-grasp fold amidoligase family protein [Clostridium perfringens]
MKKNTLILWLWNERRRKKGIKNFNKINDEEFIKNFYYKSFNKEIDLKNPKTFNEKLNWLKLNCKNKAATQCADKYEVRRYIENKGYGYILNELFGVYESVKDIDIDKLPKKFVLKATHGSGWNLIVNDKNKINWIMWKLIIKSWLKQNFYYYGREWVYRDIKPRIVCEKFLSDSNNELLDYKIYCFNGIPKFIQVDVDRFTNHTANYYDIEWNILNFQYDDENSGRILKKPKTLNEMIKISKDLSSEFEHVRIDFYEVDGKLYFGEMTFFTASGTGKFNPEEYDKILGSWLTLNN